MFSGHALWQGIIYALVMWAAKVFTAVWIPAQHTASGLVKRWKSRQPAKPVQDAVNLQKLANSEPAGESEAETSDSSATAAAPPSTPSPSPPPPSPPADTESPVARGQQSLLVPTLLLGSAMVARGEIGLLISNAARTASPDLMPEDLFIVSTWAIVLCTVVGPISVAVLVKKIKTGPGLPVEWR
jgi:hypothetical protein